MTRILDCHIHAYTPEVIKDPRAWGEAHNEPWFVYCVDPPDKPCIQAWADTDQLLRDMDAAEVEKVVMLGWYWENQETCEIQNQWFIDWHKQHPDRILGFATVRPSSGQRGLDNVKYCFDNGLMGLGELLPQAQDFSFTDDNFAKLVELAVSANAPFNIHVTPPVFNGDASNIPTPLPDYLELATTYPEAIFILAHWGGGLPFYEMNPRIRAQLTNVYYDFAASPMSYDMEIVRQVCNLIGPDRILFGTDYPIMLYPQDSREADFSRMIEEIKQVGLTQAEYDKIMGGNLLKLLNLD